MADTNQELKELLDKLQGFSSKATELKPQIDALKTAIEQLFSNSGKNGGDLLSGIQSAFTNAETAVDSYFTSIKTGTAEAIAEQKRFQETLSQTQAAIKKASDFQYNDENRLGNSSKFVLQGKVVSSTPYEGYTDSSTAAELAGPPNIRSTILKLQTANGKIEQIIAKADILSNIVGQRVEIGAGQDIVGRLVANRITSLPSPTTSPDTISTPKSIADTKEVQSTLNGALQSLSAYSGKIEELRPIVSGIREVIKTTFSTSGQDSSKLLDSLKFLFENAKRVAGEYYANVKGGGEKAQASQQKFNEKLSETQRLLENTPQYQARSYLAGRGETGPTASAVMRNSEATPPDDPNDLLRKSNALAETLHKEALNESGDFLSQLETKLASSYDKQISTVHAAVNKLETEYKKQAKAGGLSEEERAAGEAKLAYYKDLDARLSKERELHRSGQIDNATYIQNVSPYASPVSGQQFPSLSPLTGAIRAQTQIASIIPATPVSDPAAESALKDIQEKVYLYILQNVKVVKQNLLDDLVISAKEASQATNELLQGGFITKTGRNYSAGQNAFPTAGGPLTGQVQAQAPITSLSDLSKEQQTTLLSGAGITSLFKDTSQLDAFKTRLGSLGVDFKNIISITKEMSTGISTVNFSSFDKATGSVQNLTAHIGPLGNVLNDTSNRFNSFGEKIANNIVKVLQWSVAIGLVYGSISKIQQVVTEMTKIQEEMATISVTTNATGSDLQKFFDIAASAAQASGEHITDSITAFNAALKVTGNSASEFERVRIASSLLASSLALAHIGGITTAEAMDSLTAALEQSGLKLDQGTFLLNKFIAVAKISAGTAKDLADTFGITAGSAADVGVGVDELTALIGAFAAATTLSADQTGNALRAMFANFTTDKTAGVLNRYGIAVKDLSGEFLSFTDVLGNVSNLMKSGVLSDRAVAEISNALGGGSRRGAQVTALLSQYDTYAHDLGIVQAANADTGQTQDALAKVTDTLNTAITRLSNSFIDLSAALGTKGGLLTLLTGIVNILTSAVGVVNSLVSTLGPATTALIAFGLASALVSSSVGQRVGASILNSPVLGGLFNKGGGVNSKLTYDENGTVTGIATAAPNIGKQIAVAMVPVLITAFAQFGEAQKTGDWSGFVGTAIGGGIMAVVTKSSGWATVGIVLANIIAAEIKSIQEADKAAALAMQAPVPSYATALKSNPNLSTEEYRNDLVQQLTEIIKGTYAGTSVHIASQGGDILPELKIAEQQKTLLQKTFGDSIFDPTTFKSNLDKIKIVIKDANLGELIIGPTAATRFNAPSSSNLGNFGKPLGSEQSFLYSFSELDKAKLILDAMAVDVSKMKEDASTTTFGLTGNEPGLKALLDIASPEATQQNIARRFDLINQLNKGQIGNADYKTQAKALEGTLTTAVTIEASRHPEILSDTEAAKKFKDELLNVKKVLDSTTQDNRDFIAGIASGIVSTTNAIGVLKESLSALEAQKGLADALGIPFASNLIDGISAKIKELMDQVAIAKAEEAAVLKQAGQSAYKFPGFTDLSKLTTPEVNKIAQQAMGMQNAFAQSQDPTGSKGIAQILKDTAKDVVIETANGFITIHGIYSDFFSKATAGYDALKKAAENAFNFQTQRDTPISALNQIQKGINYYTQMLKALGFNEQAQTLTILFKDNQLGQLTGSQTALRLALEDLTTQVKKQITGVYNLPSGATAFVPIGAAEASANGQFPDNGAGYAQRTYAGNAATPIAGSYPQGSASPGGTIDQKTMDATFSAFEKYIYNLANKIKLSDFSGASTSITPPTEQNQKGGIPTPITPAEQARLDQRRGEWGTGTASTPPTNGQDILNTMLQMLGIGSKVLPNTGGMDSNKLYSPAINISLENKLQPVKHEFIALINLLMPGGRILANLVAPFLFEDYQKMSSSLGSSNRQSNVIVS